MKKYGKKGFWFITVLALLLILVNTGLTVKAVEVLNSDFENKKLENWIPRGDVNLKVVSTEAHQGDCSLLTTGRIYGWNGPSINIQDLVTEGKKYDIIAWVKLPAGHPEDELIMSIEKNNGESSSWDRVAGPVIVGSDKWVELKGEYVIPGGYERFTLYIESPNTTLEYYLDDVSITPAGVVKKEIQEDLQSVTELYKGDFLIGAAVEPYQLSGEHAKLLKKHYNSLTAENVMKPQSLQPEEDKFTFQEADRIVDFAQKNGLQVRGHTLLWHQQSPDWFFEDSGGGKVSRIKLLRRLKRHIQTVVNRYKGKIYAWDVVNEVIDPSSKETNGLRNNKWYQFLGEDYIAKAFEYAHEADPEAKLFINDYNLASNPGKRDLMYNLVKRLKEKGVPIDGIGMQMHVNVYDPRIAEVEKAIKKFASLGVEVQITELDMSVYMKKSQSYNEKPEDILIKQGHRYKELFELFKKYSNVITSVTFWGMADDHTWLTTWPVQRNNWPLLFDKGLKAKYAYWGLVAPDKLPIMINKAEEQKGILKTTKAVKGTPVIDAEYDDIWDSAAVISTDVWVEGDSGAIAKIRTMWNENHLYIYADVTDPVLSKENGNTWEQDSIEIFIDENNNKSLSYEDEDSQYRVNFSNEQSFDPNPVRPGFVTATRKTDKGYVVEAAIEFLTIKAKEGNSIGFDIQVNDDQGNGSRASVAIWNDLSGISWKDTSGFGNLIFVE
ncbi:MAG: 1,4-beta-xylanase [Firmicutes bacterium]|nr:1,4-beta-xylanase [Bacillota bacterium]